MCRSDRIIIICSGLRHISILRLITLCVQPSFYFGLQRITASPPSFTINQPIDTSNYYHPKHITTDPVTMSAQRAADVEMQYQPNQEQMSQASPSDAVAEQVRPVACVKVHDGVCLLTRHKNAKCTEEQPKKRTFLGMRGGGCISKFSTPSMVSVQNCSR